MAILSLKQFAEKIQPYFELLTQPGRIPEYKSDLYQEKVQDVHEWATVPRWVMSEYVNYRADPGPYFGNFEIQRIAQTLPPRERVLTGTEGNYEDPASAGRMSGKLAGVPGLWDIYYAILKEKGKPITQQIQQTQQSLNDKYNQIQQKYNSPEAQQRFQQEYQNLASQLPADDVTAQNNLYNSYWRNVATAEQRELDAFTREQNRTLLALQEQTSAQNAELTSQLENQVLDVYNKIVREDNVPVTFQDILGAFDLAPKTPGSDFLTGRISAQEFRATQPTAQTPAQPATQPATQQTQPVTQPEALLSQTQPAAQPTAQPVTQQAQPVAQPTAQPVTQPVAQPATPAESPFLTGTAPVTTAPATTTAMTAPVTAATEIPTDWNQPAIPGTSMATSQQSSIPNWVTPPSPYAMVSQVVTELTNPVTGEKFIAPTGGYSINQSALTPQSPTTTAAQQTQANQMGTGLMPSMANALGGIGSAIGNVAGGIPAGIGGQQAVPQTFLTGAATQPTGLTPESLPALRGSASGQSAVDPTLRPYLELGLRGAEQLFLQQAPSLYPGQMYVSPSQQTLDALAQTEQIARAQPSALQAAQESYMAGLGGLGFTAGGGFLGSNPFQQRAIEAATRPIMQQFEQTTLPTIAGQFSAAGRYGSGAMGRITGQAQEASSRALGDVAANIAYTDYARERGLQDAAIRNQLQASTLAPQIYGQQFLPAQQLAQVGAAREAIAAQPLQEAISRYQYQQQLPYQQLGGFLSSIYGTPLAGSQYQTPAQAQTNRAGSALGLAATGAGIGNLVGGTTGAAWGAGLGALAGLLG